jgi:hypothetical protein
MDNISHLIEHKVNDHVRAQELYKTKSKIYLKAYNKIRKEVYVQLTFQVLRPVRIELINEFNNNDYIELDTNE